jgi:formylglycine-generating enzyme required for sulfatase activity
MLHRSLVVLVLAGVEILSSIHTAQGKELPTATTALLQKMQRVHGLTPEQLQRLQHLFASSPFLGQGEEQATVHPMSREQCVEKVGKLESFDKQEYKEQCKDRFMAPLYDSNKKLVSCMDQFEFPNIPCEYPLIWVQANEAEQLCAAIGKRLCDADEWEGGCAGEFIADSLPKGAMQSVSSEHQRLRAQHNSKRSILWAYGTKQDHTLCATKSTKSAACQKALETGKGVYTSCGSNTYPAGAFPQCKSATGIYDQHGNAAEHMNLAFRDEQRRRNGGFGYTEMKGSWFIFSTYSAHQDDCRWRAPYWHGSALMDAKSHRNYHLGFRCCKNP